VVQDLRSVVKDCAACEGDHAHGEEGSEVEAEDYAANNQREGDDAAPLKERAEEREVRLRHPDERGQRREGEKRDEGSRLNDARSRHLCHEEHRQEDQPFRDHETGAPRIGLGSIEPGGQSDSRAN